jgi:hypothetical protein
MGQGRSGYHNLPRGFSVGGTRAHLGRILLELVESTSSEGVGADQRNLKKKLTASGVASSLVQARSLRARTKSIQKQQLAWMANEDATRGGTSPSTPSSRSNAPFL